MSPHPQPVYPARPGLDLADRFGIEAVAQIFEALGG
jgi:hypothetical protein